MEKKPPDMILQEEDRPEKRRPWTDFAPLPLQ
jgi:hypothetical protein